MPRRNMGRRCKPWPSICPSLSCCPCSASVSCVGISLGASCRRERWPTGYRTPPGRSNRACTCSKSCCFEAEWTMWMRTGARIKGLLHWFHVSATPWLTFYAWHRKRGQEAMDAIGILPNYTGRAIHDRLSSYDHYPCAHSICGSHLLRDCLGVAEDGKHPWAQAMYELLACMCQVTEQWRATGATALPQAERDGLVLQYFELLRASVLPLTGCC